MKTTILKILMIVFLIGAISACSSDDDTPVTNYTEENFLTEFLEVSGFDDNITELSVPSNFEQGLEFTPLVSGKITVIYVKLPEIYPELRVTIWNKSMQSVIRTETINVSSAHTMSILDISDIELEKDKEYAITMNSSSWYERVTDNVNYPITVGNIKIDAFAWGFGSNQAYPDTYSTSIYAGDLSFDFLQTE